MFTHLKKLLLFTITFCLFCFAQQTSQATTAIEDDQIFIDYPWLNNIVDVNNCSGQTLSVSLYDVEGNSYISVITNDDIFVYYDNGTLVCTNGSGLNCLFSYGLDSPSAIWTCGDLAGETTGDDIVCGYENPLDGPWISGVIANLEDGIYDYVGLQYFIHNGESYFILFEQSTYFVEGWIYNCEGNFICDNGPTNPSPNGNNIAFSQCSNDLWYASTGAIDIWPINYDFFAEYPWLNNLIDQNDCNGQTVELYTFPGNSFIYFDGNIYYENGSVYCTGSSNFDCLEEYGYVTPTRSWSCGEDNSGNNNTINGCTDPSACNYDASATNNDGSCNYPVSGCNCGDTLGCTDATATNYNANANCDDGSCQYDNGGNNGGGDQQVFTDYPWLSNVVDANNCNGQTVSVYDFTYYAFISITSADETLVYFEDGTLYCTGSSCINAYGLSNPIATWSCGNGGGSDCGNVLELDWVQDIINSVPSYCTSELYTFEYDGQPVIFRIHRCSGGFVVFHLYNCIGETICYTTDAIDSDACSPDVLDYATAENLIWTNDTTNSTVFDDYPWLSNVVNPNNCNGETISVYDSGNYAFISIVSSSETMVYFEDGTLYCTGSSCINAYGLSNPVATWSCGDTGNGGNNGGNNGETPDFSDYPWLNNVIDLDNCCNNTSVTVYSTGSYSFVYVATDPNCATETGKLYFEDGTVYCQTPTDCVNAYGLNTASAVVLWDCGMGRPETETPILETANRTDNSVLENTFNIEFNVFPNPNNGRFDIVIESESKQEQLINIYDLQGKLIESIAIPENAINTNVAIDINSFGSGMYFVELLSDYQSKVKRVVVQ